MDHYPAGFLRSEWGRSSAPASPGLLREPSLILALSCLPQVCIFLLCMPIIAAPLEAIAVLGSSSLVRILEQALIVFAGFVLAGVPLYYITHRNEGRAQCEWSR